jgi:hypothetical protein
MSGPPPVPLKRNTLLPTAAAVPPGATGFQEASQLRNADVSISGATVAGNASATDSASLLRTLDTLDSHLPAPPTFIGTQKTYSSDQQGLPPRSGVHHVIHQ